MVDFAAEKLMELEAGLETGAAYAEKTPLDFLNVMAIEIATRKRAPGLSNFAFPSCGPAKLASVTEPRGMAEKALTAVVQEAYIQSVGS